MKKLFVVSLKFNITGHLVSYLAPYFQWGRDGRATASGPAGPQPPGLSSHFLTAGPLIQPRPNPQLRQEGFKQLQSPIAPNRPFLGPRP